MIMTNLASAIQKMESSIDKKKRTDRCLETHCFETAPSGHFYGHNMISLLVAKDH